MRLQILILLMLFSVLIFSQTNKMLIPNYKKIKKEILKKDGIFFYPSLFRRYQNGDTTFNSGERRHLYYGWTFQDKYSPYGSFDYTDSINNILKNKVLTNTDYQNIIQYSDSIFHKNPFDLRAINYTLFACRKTGQTDLLNKKTSQMNVIFGAIFSSRNGVEKKNRF